MYGRIRALVNEGGRYMDRRNQEMVEDIEALSRELSQLYETHRSLDDPRIVQHSQKLDRLIVDWCQGSGET